MPLLTFLPAAIAGAKTLYTAFNKPKLKEPKYLLEGLDKQVAENQADIVNKTLMSNLTSTAKSLGAKMYQQQQRGINTMAARGELSEGQEARALLDAGTQVQNVVGEQAQGAVMSQAEANQRSRALMDEARLNVARLKDEARQRLGAETQQWKNELAGGVLDTATAGFNSIVQGIQDKNLQSTLGDFMKSTGKTNLTELDDDQLRGLLTTLTLKKMGLSMPQGTGQAPVNALMPVTQQPQTATVPTPQNPKLLSDAPDPVLNHDLSVTPPPTAQAPAPAINMELFTQTAGKPAYKTMLDTMLNEYGGNVDDPKFRAWVEKNYTAKGTFDKFLTAYLAATGGK